MDREVTFVVPGVPAAFATAGEKPWKARLIAESPAPSMGGDEAGLTARFILPTLAPAGHPLDIRTHVSHFFRLSLVMWAGFAAGARICNGGGRPKGKGYGRITISSNPVPVLNTIPSLITEVDSGALPRNATAPEVAEWSRSLLGEQVQIPGVALACYLGFGTTHQSRELAAGVVKSFIDRLYSIWGGAVGRLPTIESMN